jgi:hypothetical protein
MSCRFNVQIHLLLEPGKRRSVEEPYVKVVSVLLNFGSSILHRPDNCFLCLPFSPQRIDMSTVYTKGLYWFNNGAGSR